MQHKIARVFLFLLISLCAGGSLFAKHIAGGDFTYRRLSGNNFEITLKFFRDCTDFVAFDDTVKIGVFVRGSNTLFASYNIGRTDSGVLDLTGSSCLSPPSSVCMDKCTYVDTISLPNNPNGYYVSWERCCRNNALVNLTNPGNTGIAYYMEIPNPAIIDNSPRFNTDPLPFMCVGQDFVFDFSAVDPDGDLLVYTLETPLAGDLGYPSSSTINTVWASPTPGPYPIVQWASGYSVTNITGSAVPLSLNSTTGEMQIKADNLGYYAVAVEVKEYRGSVLIGLTRREIEFTVVSCPPNIPPQISYDNSTVENDSLTFTLFETDTLCFTVKVEDADAMTLTYNGDIFPGGSITPPYATTTSVTGQGTVSSSFCWYTSCSHGRTLPYLASFIAQDDGCPQSSTTTDNLKIFVLPMPKVPPPLLVCMDLDTSGIIRLNYADTFSYKKYIDRYEVYRSASGSPFVLYDNIYNVNINNYFDNNALYNDTTNYCYFIRGVNKCGEAGLFSDTICSLNQLTVRSVYLLSSVVNEPDITINLQPAADNPFSIFYIEKKLNNPGYIYTLYKTINGLSDAFFDDLTQLPDEESYCYTITKENSCGNISEVSNESCSILLSGQSLPAQNVLNWTAYTSWKSGVSGYALYRKKQEDASFSLVVKLPPDEFTFIDDQFGSESGNYDYVIKAEDDSLENESVSNIITLQQEAVIYAPNAFTPNDDSKNETWLPVSLFVKDFNLKVFNRWGNMVFESSDKTYPWDGKYKGSPAPQGVYFYLINYTNYIDNVKEVKKGLVSIIR